MPLETIAPTWRHKLKVDDTFVFGGDLKADPTAGALGTSGAFSKERVAAIGTTDYLELDFTFDAKANGDAIWVGLSSVDADHGATMDAAAIEWRTDQLLRFYEANNPVALIGPVTLPMSCRIVYDAGVLKFYSNAGVDTLRHTTVQSAATITAFMVKGFCVDAAFVGTSGAFHATLKGGTAVTPEIPFDGSTGRMVDEIPIFAEGVLMESYQANLFRNIVPEGFPPPIAHPRPTVGKIWPRKF